MLGIVGGCGILLGYANLASDLSKPAHNVEESDASNTRHTHKVRAPPCHLLIVGLKPRQ